MEKLIRKVTIEPSMVYEATQYRESGLYLVTHKGKSLVQLVFVNTSALLVLVLLGNNTDGEVFNHMVELLKTYDGLLKELIDETKSLALLEEKYSKTVSDFEATIIRQGDIIEEFRFKDTTSTGVTEDFALKMLSIATKNDKYKEL